MNIHILDYFENTVNRVPGKIAVVDGNREYTFLTLQQYAEKAGSNIHIRLSGIVNQPIAVYLPKSMESIIADIGILYSGNAYLNLDTKSPTARIGGILDIIKPVLVITDSDGQSKLAGIWGEEKIWCIDKDAWKEYPCGEEDMKRVRDTLIDMDPLCIINTSGSTGIPKGVVLNHRSFIDFTEWSVACAGIGEDEIMGCLSPIIFDIYSFELCVLMARGGTMVLLQESMGAFPARMLQVLLDRKVNFIFWVPTIMINIANMGLLEKYELSDLRTVWFAGEVFPTKQFNMWRRRYPFVKYINLYGPIEITLDCTYYIVEREFSDDEPLPIGYACKNTQILLLNERNEKCLSGEEGELYVRGSSLAMGYYNHPDKTREAFVQNPLNQSYPEIIYRTGDMAVENERGELLFKGRKDTLIKHSGYRIELGEIEHIIINTLRLVRNGCAVYDSRNKEIVFCYEAETEIDISLFRSKLSEVVPKYMIPGRYIYHPSMPMNANGKIDRLLIKQTVLGNESGNIL